MSADHQTKDSPVKPFWTVLMQIVIAINTVIVIPAAVFVFKKISEHDVKLTAINAAVEQVRIETDRDRLRMMAEMAANAANMRADLVARIEVINNNVLQVQTRLQIMTDMGAGKGSKQ